MSNYKLSSPVDVSSGSVTGQLNMYEAGSAFAVQVKAPAALGANVDFTLPSVVGSSGQFLQRTGASTLGWVNPSGTNVGTSLPTHITLSDGNIPKTPINVSGNPFPGVVVAYFMYNGSTLSGSPTKFTIVYSFSGGASILRVRVLDLTHTNNVIADTGNRLPGLAVTLGTFVVTTFTNVPPGQSLFFIQASISAVGTFTVSSAVMS